MYSPGIETDDDVDRVLGLDCATLEKDARHVSELPSPRALDTTLLFELPAESIPMQDQSRKSIHA